MIFLSYREEISNSFVAILNEFLTEIFPGKIFLAPRNLQGSQDYQVDLEKNVAAADVMIVVIGKNWHYVKYGPNEALPEVTKLANPKDWVRREVSLALSQKQTLVLPVLHDQAQRPSPQILSIFELGELSNCQFNQ